MTSLTQVCEWLQQQTQTLQGIKSAPPAPPEHPGAFPFAVSAVRTFEAKPGPAGVLKFKPVTFATQIHIARAELPTAWREAMIYGDLWPALIGLQPTLGGTVDTVEGLRGRFVTLTYGTLKTLGWDFEVDVKMDITL